MATYLIAELKKEKICVYLVEKTRKNSPICLEQVEIFDVGYEDSELKLPDWLSDKNGSTLAVLAGGDTLYHTHSFPFKDLKKIEQILPLQLQDLVPFEPEEFVSSAVITGGNPDGTYKVISALTPIKKIEEAVNRLTRVHLVPKQLVTRASIVLAGLSSSGTDNSGILLDDSNEGITALVYNEKTPIFIQEFSFNDRVDAERQVRTLQLKMEAEQHLSCPNIQALSHNDSDNAYFTYLVNIIEKKTTAFNIKASFLGGRGRLVEVVSILRDELFYFILLVVFISVYLASTFYASIIKVDKIQDTITERVQVILPDEVIAKGSELSFIEDRVKELEKRQKEVGGLSFFSPLTVLKELSEVLTKEVDVTIESLSVGHARLSFTGTALNFPTVGKITTLLEKHKEFCEVKIDPKGDSQDRVKFQAEIKLCE